MTRYTGSDVQAYIAARRALLIREAVASTELDRDETFVIEDVSDDASTTREDVTR